MLLIPNTTADHAILYTNSTYNASIKTKMLLVLPIILLTLPDASNSIVRRRANTLAQYLMKTTLLKTSCSSFVFVLLQMMIGVFSSA